MQLDKFSRRMRDITGTSPAWVQNESWTPANVMFALEPLKPSSSCAWNRWSGCNLVGTPIAVSICSLFVRLPSGGRTFGATCGRFLRFVSIRLKDWKTKRGCPLDWGVNFRHDRGTMRSHSMTSRRLKHVIQSV